MSDCFLPDGDDTAAAMAVLHATGHKVEERTLEAFASDDHYCAYRGELQPSLSVTAHALHVLALLGKNHAASRKFLMSRQRSDGRWLGDKWNGSWVYTTSHAMIALHEAGDVASVEAGLDALLLYQHEDGGWGMHTSTPEETAYAVLGLRALRSRLPSAGHGALARGKHWLLTHYQPFQRSSTNCWLGKEMYRPQRLARIIELAASLPQSSEG